MDRWTNKRAELTNPRKCTRPFLDFARSKASNNVGLIWNVLFLIARLIATISYNIIID